MKFVEDHETQVEKAKKLAEKAYITLEKANLEAIKAEEKFDETIDGLRKEIMNLNEKFAVAIEQRNVDKTKLNAIKELVKTEDETTAK